MFYKATKLKEQFARSNEVQERILKNLVSRTIEILR